MSKGLKWLIGLALVALAVFFWVKGVYNGFVRMDEQVTAAWSQVENVYQRRADLIPNLVATVKGYAEHESETLEGVVNARAAAMRTTVDAADLTPERLAEFQRTQGELSQALGRLMVLTENYPDLKANRNFQDLQAQLEGTENRIAVERKKFNETARAYNTAIRVFPKNLLAGMFGFEKRAYFEASEGAEVAPVVSF